MKRFILALTVCFLLGSFSAPATDLTAAHNGQQQSVKAITQESPTPVEPVVEPTEATEVAKLVVEGPTKVEVGQLVVISVEKSSASSFKWIVLPSTDNFLVIDEGRRVCFSSGESGEFRFIVACSLGDTCDVAVHTVTVIGNDPTKVNGLESKVALWCEDVESDTKREEALLLAQSFASVAMVMDGGTLTTPKEIVQATYRSNREAHGDKMEDWLPFREGLQAELTRLANAGLLPDTASHIRVWREIAAALRTYADTL